LMTVILCWDVYIKMLSAILVVNVSSIPVTL
jgi:hypothetical protein